MSSRWWIAGLLCLLGLFAFFGFQDLAFFGESDAVPAAGADALRTPAQAAEIEHDRGEVRSDATREPVAESVSGAKAAQNGTLRIRAWLTSGSKRRLAAGVPIKLRPHLGADRTFDVIHARAGADGTTTVRDLPVQTFDVVAGRGLDWYRTVEVRANTTVEVELEIKSSVRIRGIVKDATGTPVPGAVIEALRLGGSMAPFEVGRSGADGRFEIDPVAEYSSIGARARGLRSRYLRTLTAESGGEQFLEIVLRERAGTIRGTVKDSRGEPVAGAIVRIGRPRAVLLGVELPGGNDGFLNDLFETRTDDQGRFLAAGVPVGRHPIHIRSRRGAPFMGHVEVVDHTETLFDAELEPGAVCEGTVSQGDGTPAVGCLITQSSGPDFFRAELRTDSRGRFRIEGLAAGECSLMARHFRGPGGRRSVKLQLVAGAVTEWSPKLSGAVTLRGVVRTEAGRPLAGVGLQVIESSKRPGASMLGRAARADDQGCFEVANLPAGPVLMVMVTSGVQNPIMVRNVDATAGECVIEVPEPGRPTAAVRGSVRDAHGLHVSLARVSLMRGPAEVAAKVPGDGAFEFPKLLPSEYTIQVQAPGFVTERRHKDLAEDETWHVGQVVLRRGGWISAEVEGNRGADRRDLSLTVHDADRAVVARVDCKAKHPRSMLLPPGRYKVTVEGAGVAAASIPIEIKAGTPTAVRVPNAKGFPVRFRVKLPRGKGGVRDVTLRVQGAAGSCIDRLLPRSVGTMRPFACDLAPGRYRARAELSGGHAGTAEFVVESGGVEQQVDIEIR